MASYDYDLFVIGGGSGGVRAGRLTAAMGKRVAIAEEHRFGGTCVIRGCVPKKLFVYASQFSEHFEDAAGYGWTVGETSFDWPTLIANKDREIARWKVSGRAHNAGAEIIESRATLTGKHTVRIEATGEEVSAATISSPPGRPSPHRLARLRPHDLLQRGFRPAELPKSIAIAGGGYIAVEFANIFHGLGVETTLVIAAADLSVSTWTCAARFTRRCRRRASRSCATRC